MTTNSALANITNMAQLHFLTIETKALLTRPNKGLPIDEGWFDEFEENGFTIYGPTDIKLIEQTDEKQIVKATIDVHTSVTISDEEYKAWKNVDWWEEFNHEDITIKVLYDEKFEVVSHDSEWVDDSELDE